MHAPKRKGYGSIGKHANESFKLLVVVVSMEKQLTMGVFKFKTYRAIS